MIRTFFDRQSVWLVPVILLLVSFGRLVAEPSSLLVDANRPTVDRARVVAAPPGNDLTRQFLPLHFWINHTWRRTDVIPQWDDRGFGGRPLVGNPQAGLFYPPAWVAWLVPEPSVLGWVTLAHLIWACFGMIRLTRTLELSENAQMVAAGCFVLSPYVLAQTFEGHYPHVWAVAWYPWAFAATIQVSRGRWRSGLGLPIALASVFLVGHPQEGYYLLIALGVWVFSDLVRSTRLPESRKLILSTTTLWAGVGLLAVGLLAVEIIPEAMAQGWSLRSARMPLRLASRYHPSLINALQLLNPFALGGPSDYFGPENYWETVVSIGMVPLILAGVGMFATADSGRVRRWVVLLVVATLFALGRKFAIFALLYEIVPGMDRFRVPSRSLFLTSLAAAVLVGYGVESLGKNSVVGRADWVRFGKRWLYAVIGLLVAVGWGGWRSAQANLAPAPIGSTESMEQVRSWSRGISDRDRFALGLDQIARQPPFWLGLLGMSGALVWGRLQPGRQGRVAAGLGLLGLIELTVSGHQLLVTSPPAAFLRSEAVENAIRQAAHFRSGEPPLRVRADEAIVSDLMAVELGLSKTDINDTFQIQHAADLYQQFFDLSRFKPVSLANPMDGPVADRIQRTQQAVFDRMGVALICSDRTRPRLEALIESNRWPIVASVPARSAEGDGWVVAENRSAMPRAYVVPRVDVVCDERDSVGRFAEIDPRQAVVMTEDPLSGLPASTGRQPFQAAEWVSSQPDKLVLQVTTEAPGLLVVADTWMPGWSARVDGRAAEIWRGNHAQRVIALPDPGCHQVLLSYQTPGLRLGRAISLGSLAVWSLLWIVGRCPLLRGKSPVT